MKHTTLIRPIAFLLILGGLLLPALIGCEVGEIPDDTTTTVADTTDAPETPAEPIALSSLHEEKTITQVEFFNRNFSDTQYLTNDPQRIAALNTVLSDVTVQKSSHYLLISSWYSIEVYYEDGYSGLFHIAYDSNAINYTIYDSNRQQQSLQKYWLTDESKSKLQDFIDAQIEQLLPLTQVPDPEFYLGSNLNQATIHTLDKKVELSSEQISAVSSRLKQTLTGLPLCGGAWGETKNISVTFRYSDGGEVYLTIHSAGVIDVEIHKGEWKNKFHFPIPSVDAYEYITWLSEYSDGDSAFPSLENYLKQSMYRIEVYDTADASYHLSINKQNEVTAFHNFIKKLQFISLSEEIPEDDTASDGMKIVLITRINSNDLVMEFDASGRINCQYLQTTNQTPTYAAQYTLSPEDLASLEQYIRNLKAEATAVPTIDEYFAGDVFANFYYSSAEPDIYASLKGKDKIAPIQSYLQTMHFTRSETAQTVNRDNGFSLNVTRSDHSVILRFDLQTGYLSAVWDGLPEEILPAQYYQFSPAEVEGLLDLFDPYLEEWEEPIPETVPDTTE
ncbi:MAG: hypothetical protein IJW98_00650 [Clostridia bacterium]|nr:hypothetical protein [Clostridia bacterium]